MRIGLTIAGGLTGAVAAILWLLATRRAPQPGPPGMMFFDVGPSPKFASDHKAATNYNKWAAVLALLSAILWTAAAFAQDDAKGRAKLVEIVAFAKLGAQPCAYALDDAVAKKWNAEVLTLLFALKPPLTDAEIAAKEKEAQDYRTQLGETKWCELYTVEMREADLIFSMAAHPR